MKLFERLKGDKATAIERAYFDADRGCITLALERIADIRGEFPQDAVLEYAEGILRKDFLGQGLKANEQFRLAQSIDKQHVFSAFNAAKYARSEEDYRQRVTHARSIAPRDPDLRLFDQIDAALAQGRAYCELLSEFVFLAQREGRHGDVAAVAEIALETENWSRMQEINLRTARCASLRELDRAEEAARQARMEDYQPSERSALAEALTELEHVIALDSMDPIMHNFKSAWLALMRRYEEAIAAADEALALQPRGYLKPLTNKAWSLFKLGQRDEVVQLCERTISSAKDLGSEFDDDVAKARGILEAMSVATDSFSDDEKLAAISGQCVRTGHLTCKEAQEKWQAAKRGFDLTRGIQSRSARYGRRWDPNYITMMAELLHDFSPEWVWIAVLKLLDDNRDAYEHYLYASLFVAAQSEGVMVNDACQFTTLLLLGATEPIAIRRLYREVVLAPAGVDERFVTLATRMRDHLEHLHPDLPSYIADQEPLTAVDCEKATSVTLSRFSEEHMTGWRPAIKRSGCLNALVTIPFVALLVLFSSRYGGG